MNTFFVASELSEGSLVRGRDKGMTVVSWQCGEERSWELSLTKLCFY